MQIIKSFFIGLMVFMPFLKSYASGLQDSASIGFDTYSDNHDVQIYSPTFSLMKTISKNFLVGVKMRIDAIAAASIRNGGHPDRPDTVTGASDKSGFGDVRYAPTFLAAYDDGQNALSGGFYYSKEVDYTGKAFFLNYVRQLNEDNTAVAIGFSQSNDTWSPVFKRALPDDTRKEQKIDFSVNQLISPTFSMQLVYSYMNSKGFLSSPYHYIDQDTSAKFENYPSARKGHAFAIKGVKMLNDDNSMNYSYRYYTDDWSINSHTLSTEWLHDMNQEWTAGARLRYYTQSKASFAKEIGTYSKTDTYFASDYRMSAFNAYDVGIPLIYTPADKDYKVSFSIDYYRTNKNAYMKEWYGTDYLQAVYTTIRIDYEF